MSWETVSFAQNNFKIADRTVSTFFGSIFAVVLIDFIPKFSITEVHLPLHCRKCEKVSDFQMIVHPILLNFIFTSNQIYKSKEDFKEIEKCMKSDQNKKDMKSEDVTENKENIPVEPEKDKIVPHKIIIEEVDEELLTPLSKINLKWRRKSAGLSHSDSSVTSVSAISHPNQSQLKIAPDSNSKLVRTTSTPMHQLLPQPNSLDSLCGSSYQASSIDHGSGNETDQSASITSNNCSPSPAIVMKRTQFPIQCGKQTRRLPKAQTPLRQVMSKSIQRALMEQRYERTKLTANVRMPRKMIFDSMSSSDGSIDEVSALVPPKTPNVSGVLDLRTTPVLKRTMSEPISYSNKHKEQTVKPARQKSDESLFVEALIEEHYKRSDFRARIEAISDNVINATKYEPGITPIPQTPEIKEIDTRIENDTIEDFKSCLEDKTPGKKSAIVTPMPKGIDEQNSFTKEIWYTPKNISTNFQLPKSPETFKSHDSDPEDEVFTTKVEPSTAEPPNRIWQLFSTVIRIASGSLTEAPNNPKKKTLSPKRSIFTRSLSHLGFIRSSIKRPSYTKPTPIQHLKRKRKTSSQSSLNNGETSIVPELRSPVAKKYKSITGRKPIQRMLSK